VTEIYEYSACEVVAKLKSGEVSIQESLDALQTRIKIVDKSVNALPTLCFDRAAEHAKLLQGIPVEQRGILCGLPLTIKDLTDVKGVRTTSGSMVYTDCIPESSNQLVTRLESCGGVVYAKSNTPEFGAGGITFNDVFGITRCPHDLSKTSAGSSGGAAASLASGTAWLSHGSDMAGSLRTPAAFCGVTSLRPSPGTIRADSAYMPFDVLGADGPMARDIADLALFADAMRNEDTSAMQQAIRCDSNNGLNGLNVAVSHNLGITSVADDVAELFQTFIDEHLGGCKTLSETHPDLTGVHESFDTLRAQAFAIRIEPILEKNRHIIKPEVVWNVDQGLASTSLQLRNAIRSQGRIVNEAARFMRDVDVLICPATSLTSVSAEVRYPGDQDGVPIPEYYRWLAIAYASTMTTLPIITVPVGHTKDGLPFGVQLIGKPWGEAALFKVAQKIERVVGRSNKPVDPI
jgi:amidase